MASRDQPSSIISLGGGLDLVTSKVETSPGSLQDCLNYEVAFRRGYRAIDGFTRYDGQDLPSRAQIYDVADRYASASDPNDPSPTGTFIQGEKVIYRYISGYADGNFLYTSIRGYCVEVPTFNVPTPDPTVRTGQFYFEEIPMPANIPSWVTATAIITTQIIGNVSLATISNNVPQTVSYTTIGEYNDIINNSFDTLRTNTSKVPGTSAIGLHLFNDVLHGVTESLTYEYDSGVDYLNLVADDPIPTAALITDTLPPVSYLPNAFVLNLKANGVDPDIYGKIEVVSTNGEVFTDGQKVVLFTTLNLVNVSQLSEIGAQVQVTGRESGWFGVIREYVHISGSTLDGTGVGIGYADTSPASPVDEPTDGEILENLFSQPIAVVEYHHGYSTNNAGTASMVLSSDAIDASGVLVAANSVGSWSVVNMGHEVRFNAGAVEPVTIYEAGGTIDDITVDETGELLPMLGTDVTDSSAFTSAWTLGGGATDLADAVAASDGKYAQTSIGGASLTSQWLKFQDFRAEISNLSSITGVEVIIEAKYSSGSAPTFNGVQLVLPNGSFSNLRGSGAVLTGADVDYTFGSAADNFGASLTPAIVGDATFGLRMQFKAPSSGTFPSVVQVNHVRVNIHHRTGTTTVYLRKGGADLATAELVYAHVDGGRWSAGDAEGIMTMRNISAPSEVVSGMQIRTEASGGGALIATTAGPADPLRLPSRADIDAVNGKYQFLESNFFAAPWLEAVYGVSGADHAFVFNQEYVFKIRTGNEAFPRHVSRFADQLALGYDTGSVDLSAPALPDLFDGEAGAATLGFGQKVVGLLPLSGQAMAVFTNYSTHAIVSGADGIQQQVISPSSGAIEYTVTDMGIPVFCDFRGIGTISATDRYGDFRLGRLTEAIHPFLLPRVQGGRINSADPVSILDVEVVRNKNQYRVYFSDGLILTMTMAGEQSPPEFTLQKYWLDDSSSPLIPIAVTSGVMSNGQDRVFASFEDQDYVYELDRGNSFDGYAKEGYFSLNPHFAGRPDVEKRVNVALLDVIIEGPASIATSVSTDYSAPDGTTAETVTLLSESSAYREPPFPVVKSTEFDREGRDVALRVDYSSSTDAPHTIQSVIYVDAESSGVRKKLR